MTRRRALKQRVRARMAKTGERYTTALSHLRPVEQVMVEVPFIELTVEGLACRVRWWKSLRGADCRMLSVAAGRVATLAVIGLEVLVTQLPRLRKLRQALQTPLTDFAALQGHFERASAQMVLEVSGLFLWL